jgi:anti-sigma factor RsiW
VSDHERFSQWSAAYVLGALDGEDRREFEHHLGSCDRCKDEVSRFAPIPGLLARIESIETVPVAETVFEGVLGRVHSERARLLSSRNRWRLGTLASTVAAVVLLLLGLPGWISPERVVIALDSELSVSGEVGLEAKAWGTAVTLDVEGLPERDVYVAWAVDHDGEWQQIAAWGPVPGPRVSVEGACSWHVDELSTIVITTDDAEEVLASGQTTDT